MLYQRIYHALKSLILGSFSLMKKLFVKLSTHHKLQNMFCFGFENLKTMKTYLVNNSARKGKKCLAIYRACSALAFPPYIAKPFFFPRKKMHSLCRKYKFVTFYQHFIIPHIRATTYVMHSNNPFLELFILSLQHLYFFLSLAWKCVKLQKLKKQNSYTFFNA